MKTQDTGRDERTVAVENAGYRWSYLVLSFGLLGLTAYRSLARGEAVWDLLGLIILGGMINAVYQGTRQVLNGRWIVMTIATLALAAVVAILILALSTR